jgi:hypothetical protein
MRRALFIAVVAVGCVPTNRWWDRLRATDFPARVASIEFPQGKLARGIDLFHGAWTVALTQAASATGYFGPQGIGRIDVRGLNCKNKVIGESRCSLMIVRPSPYASSYDPNASPCMLYPERSAALPIECPLDIVLDH